MVGPSVFRQILLHAALLALALPRPARAGYVMRRAEHGKDNIVSMTVTSDAQFKPAELPQELPPDEAEAPEEVGKGFDLGQGAANSTAFPAAADGECSGCFVKWMGGKKKCMPADSLIEDQKLKKCDDWKKEVCGMFPNAPYYSYRRRYLYAKIAHQYCPHTCAKYNDLCVEHSTEITIIMETPAPTTEFLLDAESAKAKPGKSTAHAKRTTALKLEESAPDDDDDDGGDDDGGDDGGKESNDDTADNAIDEKEDAADAAEDAKQAEEAASAAPEQPRDNDTSDAEQPQEEQSSDDDTKTSDADTEQLEEEATHENNSDDKDAKEDAESEQQQQQEPAEERSDDDPHDGSLAEHESRQVQLPSRPEDAKGADPDSKATAKVDVGSMERQIKKIRDENMTRKKEAAEEKEKILGTAKDHSKEGIDGDDEVEDPGPPDQEQEPTMGSAGDEEGAGGVVDPLLRQEEVPRAPQRVKIPE